MCRICCATVHRQRLWKPCNKQPTPSDDFGMCLWVNISTNPEIRGHAQQCPLPPTPHGTPPIWSTHHRIAFSFRNRNPPPPYFSVMGAFPPPSNTTASKVFLPT